MLLRAENLSSLDGIVHGFTTRSGGVSSGELESLNLGWREQEQEACLVENWERVASVLGVEATAIAMVDQVHGEVVLVANDGGGVLRPVGQGDGLVCTRRGHGVAVRVADCVPILMACQDGVAAVHAGWRGTAAAIVCRAVEALCETCGVLPGDLVVAIGPCIGPCCYQVGEEVVVGIGQHLERKRFVVGRSDPPRVDLALANRLMLEAVGVSDIECLDCCTRCDPRFYSHRGDGALTGRFAGVIARTSAGQA